MALPVDAETQIQAIFKHGCYSKEGRDAVAHFVGGGEPALEAFMTLTSHDWPTELHPRDVADTVSDLYSAFAKRIPDAVIDRRDVIGDTQVFWALGAAKGRRSIDVLIGGLTNKNQYSRWAAAESLIRRKSKRAVPALIAALKDRSSMVKFTIVQSMKAHETFRSPDALPALRRIIASKSVQKRSPGTWKIANEVVEMIEQAF